MFGVPNLDEDQANADWVKTMSWDLPTTPDAFLAVIGGPGRLSDFMGLPAAQAMPGPLRHALGV